MTRGIVRSFGFVLLVGLLVASVPVDAAVRNQDPNPYPSPGTGGGGCPLMLIYPDCVNCSLTSVTFDLYGGAVCNYTCRQVHCVGA
jgi:hypothetical protein